MSQTYEKRKAELAEKLEGLKKYFSLSSKKKKATNM